MRKQWVILSGFEVLLLEGKGKGGKTGEEFDLFSPGRGFQWTRKRAVTKALSPVSPVSQILPAAI